MCADMTPEEMTNLGPERKGKCAANDARLYVSLAYRYVSIFNFYWHRLVNVMCYGMSSYMYKAGCPQDWLMFTALLFGKKQVHMKS